MPSSSSGSISSHITRPTVATARRSGALTLFPLPDQLLDRARQRRLEVDQLRPRRGHDDPDHTVVERTDLGLPLDPLLGRHLVAAVHLEVLIRDALDHFQFGPAANQQDLGRVHLGVDCQGNRRALAQGRELRGVLRRAHDDLRAVPGEPDRDITGGAILGDVGQAGQVAGQQLLADRSVQNLGDLVRLHGYLSHCRVLGRPSGPSWPLVSWDGASATFSTSDTTIFRGTRQLPQWQSDAGRLTSPADTGATTQPPVPQYTPTPRGREGPTR